MKMLKYMNIKNQIWIKKILLQYFHRDNNFFYEETNYIAHKC